MLSFTCARTPGAGGPFDARSQQLFTEVLNIALTGEQNEPIAFTENGRLMYQKNGQMIDRTRFAAQVAEQAGDLTFRSKAIARLFGENGQEIA